MSTHNISFHGEIRKNIYLSRPVEVIHLVLIIVPSTVLEWLKILVFSF